MPKKFANHNKSRTFLYDIMNDKFLDFEKKEYKTFPILPDSIIYYPEEKGIMESIKMDLINSLKNEIVLIEKNKDISIFKDETKEEINTLLNNEIYISIIKNKCQYYYKFGESYGYSFKVENNFFTLNFNKIFEIKIKSN